MLSLLYGLDKEGWSIHVVDAFPTYWSVVVKKLYPKHTDGGKQSDVLPVSCPWAKTGDLAGLTMFAEEPMHIFMRVLLLILLQLLLLLDVVAEAAATAG